MKIAYFCEFCNRVELGLLLDTKSVSNLYRLRIAKCLTCRRIGMEFEEITLKIDNTVHALLAGSMGCLTRWRQNH